MGYLDQVLRTCLIYYCVATDMQNGDEGLPSIFLCGQGLLVKNAHNS